MPIRTSFCYYLFPFFLFPPFSADPQRSVLPRTDPPAFPDSIQKSFRPPAVPLIACDPYFSVWSCADNLTDDAARHWTGTPHRLTSLVRIDGKVYRLMGDEPKEVPPMRQISVEVLPTRTIYTFAAQEGMTVQLLFIQPALPDDLDWISRPAVQICWAFRSHQNKTYDVQVYFDASAEIAVHEPSQEVVFGQVDDEPLSILKVGTAEQNILGRKGDNVRIDWGYFYASAVQKELQQSAIAPASDCRGLFIRNGQLPETQETGGPVPAANAPVLAFLSKPMPFDGAAEFGVTLAYDDLYSILYFGQKLLPFWKRNGMKMNELLKTMAAEFSSADLPREGLNSKCERFDRELWKDLEVSGGRKYAQIACLAYRQALGANKIAADAGGMPLMFSKECFSNGCMGTVDVFYPMAPQFLVLSPVLARGSFIPILDYAQSGRWKFPYAPHDLGRYPHALGQVYGGGETSEARQMPVEECGNMLLLCAAVCQAEQDPAFARQYWPLLTQWARYLKDKGLDPENQLCTDDFAGHLARNVNLSVKAICGLGAYAKMARMLGEEQAGDEYRSTAEGFVKEWLKMADDGDHYRLTFDKPGTWSQKYNLVWDRLLELNLFPPEVAAKELAYYRKIQNPYGLPLDSRSDYTKLDWIFWSATMTGNREDFYALIDPVYRFLNETPDRVPMTDWYWTQDAKKKGFQARPVVGAVFIKLMDDPAVWRKWTARADTPKGTWAPLPRMPKIVDVVPASNTAPAKWRYTFEKPGEDWMKKNFNAENWKEGPGGFGTKDTPGAVIGTEWNTKEIWLRREIELPENLPAAPRIRIHHDEDVTVYINGVEALSLDEYSTDYEVHAISAKAARTLKAGMNLIAVYCRQTGGGQYIDLGIAKTVLDEE